jgi:N,N'-diacetyllegionaminate synthase|tara:strand:- start:2090 stop:2920 length:831 start_codon:yes stop_codon:yes gene_type:complete
MVKNNFFKKLNNFIIAEAGINHNGKIKTALRLIDVAKKNGASAIKFQTYITEKRIKKKYRKIFDILKKCELKFEEFKIISDYCRHKKINFFSTPFDKESVNFLDSINVKLFKIASFDIGNHELINEVLKTKKPTIISTGMASLKEIDKVYKIYKKNKVDLALLHCVSSYPNTDSSSYLSNINFLKNRFDCEIGISDHTNDIKIPIYGNLIGANIIEKHLKISENHKCVDAPVSITGKQLYALKLETENIKKILNVASFGIRKVEKGSRIFKRNKIL